MATKKKSGDGWISLLGVVAVIALVWFLYPKKARAAGSGGAGAGGAGPLQKYPLSGSAKPGSQGSMPIGGAMPKIPGGGQQNLGPAAAFDRWLSGMRSYDLPRVSSYYTDTNAALKESIPLQGMSLFDVNQLATDLPTADSYGYMDPSSFTSGDFIDTQPFDWGGYSPNDFLVTQDLPTSDNSSSSDYAAADALDQFYVDTGAMIGNSLDGYAGDSYSGPAY